MRSHSSSIAAIPLTPERDWDFQEVNPIRTHYALVAPSSSDQEPISGYIKLARELTRSLLAQTCN